MNLFDSEALVKFLNESTLAPGTKNMTILAYRDWLRMQGLPVPKIRFYAETPGLPFIPTEKELDMLISGVRLKRAAFLKLLKDSGCRPIEAYRLKWTFVDSIQKTVSFKSTKRGNPRNIRVSDQCLNMIFALDKKNEYIFSKSGNPELFSRELNSNARNYMKARKRLSIKLQNPRLNQISLYTFRHWKATTEYLRTRDIFHVKELLGHKKIDTTLRYIQVANSVCSEDQAYTCKVAKTENDAKELIESGLDYVTEIGGSKLFRKRK